MEKVHTFTDLESNRLRTDFQKRIKKVQYAFNSLKRMWNACEIEENKVIQSCVKSLLPYKTETYEHKEAASTHCKHLLIILYKKSNNLFT